MKRLPSKPSAPRVEASPLSSGEIDAFYGLEPVFEPDTAASDLAPGTTAVFHTVRCPYCGEPFETLVDPCNGGATYIEDCQICCQPIEFELQLDAQGAFAGLRVRRS